MTNRKAPITLETKEEYWGKMRVLIEKLKGNL